MYDLDHRLAAYGSDLSRWPDGSAEAREALLGQPEFRRAWERERDLDRKLADDRDQLEAEVARSGALARLGRLAARRASGGMLGDISWRRVAAAVIFAGVLGGALDLMLPSPPAEPIEMALVDPLDSLDLQ